ncbi:uncharacterized protein LOC135464686 isoform X2 [Liolophura sinensis]|uniref:uncharacterized protein LOC135464686 isoform X2 n=1 Tax=Liolophura sinensis TaxID=3198878 RepID=UPI00315859A6
MDKPSQSALPTCPKAIKTITVVHHKRVTPSSGLPITPQSDKLQQGGRRKVISLLVSPVDSGSKSAESQKSANSAGEATNFSEVIAPRPVNLVRRLANNQTVSSALTEALPFIPGATPTPTSPPGTSTSTSTNVKRSDGVPARTPVSGQNHALPQSQKSVRVVTVRPEIGPVRKPGVNLDESLKASKNPDYNKTLLDYLNKTLSKSGRVTMIKDGKQLREEIQNAGDKLVVVDFFSMGSSACQRTAPQVQQLSLEYEDVVFLKVDVEHTQDATLMYNVQTTPTFVLLRGGVRVYQLETPDVMELEERIKTFHLQAPPKIRQEKSKIDQPETCNYLDNSGHLSNKDWELDPFSGQMKEKSSVGKDSKSSSSTDFVKQVLKDWLVTKPQRESPESETCISPQKVTLPFLKEQEVQLNFAPEEEEKDGSNCVDVESIHENSSGAQSSIFGSIKIADSRSIQQEAMSKEETPKTLSRKQNSQQSKPKSQSSPVATTTNVVVSPYLTPPFVSQEEPRDIEIAVPMTSVTPTSSPFKRMTAPSSQMLFGGSSPGAFWKSISKDVIRSSDEEDVADEYVELDDHDDDGDDDRAGGDGEGRVEGSGIVSKSGSFSKESRAKDFVARSNDSVKSLSWLNQPSILTPSSSVRSKSSKTIVTEQVFESGEDMFSKEKPEGATYFSISSRPRLSPPVESSEVNATRESVSLSSIRTDSSSAIFVKVSPPASNKNKSNKRRISSYNAKQVVPEKRSKMEEQKPEKKSALSASQSDDNSDNCFVILSRDPRIEELLSAKKKSAPAKKKRTSSALGNTFLKKQKTSRNQEIDDSTESTDLDPEKQGDESGMKVAGDGTHAAQLLTEPGPKRCPVCSKSLCNRSSLRRHIRMLHGLDPNSSDLGKLPVPTEPVTQLAPQSKHPNKFTCLKCDRYFESAIGVKRHAVQIHRNIKDDEPQFAISATKAGSEIWTCVICDKDFYNSTGLLKHNNVLHRNTKESKMFAQSLFQMQTYCWKCQKNFSSKKCLRRHVKVVHRVKSGVLPQNLMSAAGTKSSQTVSKPQQKTSSKPGEGGLKVAQVEDAYQCPSCQMIYKDRRSCYKHIVRVHRRKLGVLVIRRNVEKENTYCWKCDKTFSSSKCFHQHVRVIHKIHTGKLPPKPERESSKAVSAQGATEGKKGLKCSRCQELCPDMSSLLLHVRDKHKPGGGARPRFPLREHRQKTAPRRVNVEPLRVTNHHFHHPAEGSVLSSVWPEIF